MTVIYPGGEMLSTQGPGTLIGCVSFPSRRSEPRKGRRGGLCKMRFERRDLDNGRRHGDGVAVGPPLAHEFQLVRTVANPEGGPIDRGSDRCEANLRLLDRARHRDTDRIALDLQLALNLVIHAGVPRIILQQQHNLFRGSGRPVVDLAHLERQVARAWTGIDDTARWQRDERENQKRWADGHGSQVNTRASLPSVTERESPGDAVVLAVIGRSTPERSVLPIEKDRV